MKTTFSITLAASLFFPLFVQADTLELKSGQVVEGTYQGGTAQTIRFQTGSETKVFQRNEIVALTLTGAANAANAGASASIGGEAAAATGAAAGQPTQAVTIPAGTALQVRMVDGVDSSKDQAGTPRLSPGHSSTHH